MHTLTCLVSMGMCCCVCGHVLRWALVFHTEGQSVKWRLERTQKLEVEEECMKAGSVLMINMDC